MLITWVAMAVVVKSGDMTPFGKEHIGNEGNSY